MVLGIVNRPDYIHAGFTRCPVSAFCPRDETLSVLQTSPAGFERENAKDPAAGAFMLHFDYLVKVFRNWPCRSM